MWPVTMAFPKYKETYIITLVDKYSALRESFRYYKRWLNSKRIYRYAYIFLCLIFVGKLI